jgi:hypothetical protein
VQVSILLFAPLLNEGDYMALKEDRSTGPKQPNPEMATWEEGGSVA